MWRDKGCAVQVLGCLDACVAVAQMWMLPGDVNAALRRLCLRQHLHCAAVTYTPGCKYASSECRWSYTQQPPEKQAARSYQNCSTTLCTSLHVL
jgi:hypothetical protein